MQKYFQYIEEKTMQTEINNLIEIDSVFSKHYRALLSIQEEISNQLKVYPFDLDKSEITEAVIARMDAFWYFHVHNNKVLLGRQTNTTAADFFTETCLLFIKSYFLQKGLVVKSEKDVRTGINDRKEIRPDISLWCKDEKKCLAIIELKVSNGFKGKYIIPHLQERERIIRAHHPECIFGTIAFWNFFDVNMDGWGTKYVGLKQWNEKLHHPNTGGRIESMIKYIEKEMLF